MGVVVSHTATAVRENCPDDEGRLVEGLENIRPGAEGTKAAGMSKEKDIMPAAVVLSKRVVVVVCTLFQACCHGSSSGVVVDMIAM